MIFGVRKASPMRSAKQVLSFPYSDVSTHNATPIGTNRTLSVVPFLPSLLRLVDPTERNDRELINIGEFSFYTSLPHRRAFTEVALSVLNVLVRGKIFRDRLGYFLARKVWT